MGSDTRRVDKKRGSARKSRETSDSERKTGHEKPVSLHPLEFEEAVKGLLQVEPEKKDD